VFTLSLGVPARAQSKLPGSRNAESPRVSASNREIVLKHFASWSFQIGPISAPVGGAGWTKLQPANRIIQLPAGMKLALVASPGLSNLSDLRSLSPDSMAGLDLSNASIRDSDLAAIKHLTGLRRLVLGKTDVSDRGLVYLKGLTKIKLLDLEDTCVSDRGLLNLLNMKDIEYLSLNGTKVSGSGLRALKPSNGRLNALGLERTYFSDMNVSVLADLHHINTLFIDRTSVTDAGVAKLLRQSEFLYIFANGTKINGSGFKDPGRNAYTLMAVWLNDSLVDDKAITGIASCKTLRSLSLDATAISDAAMPIIASLTQLQTLSLRKTKLTDAALPYLTKLSRLREIQLPHTISREVGLKLKHMLPECKVRREHA
jgi:Leucine-rich repeat (LRR) protein